MFCANCGSLMNDNDVFCPECGARVEINEGANQSQQPQYDQQQQYNQQQYNQQQQQQYNQSQQQYNQQQYNQQQYNQQQYNQQQYNQQQYNQQPQYNQPQYNQQQYGQPQPNTNVKLKVPKAAAGLKLPVVIGTGAAVVAVAAVGVAFNYDKVSNFAKKTFSSPEEYYQYVETKAIEDLASAGANTYNSLVLNSLNVYDKSMTGTATLEIGDGASQLIKQAKVLGYDFTWLEDVSISATTSVKDQTAALSATASANGIDVISGNIIMDLSDSSIYMQIPEVASKYIGVDFGAYTDISYGGEVAQMEEIQKICQDVVNACPTQEQAEQLIEKYLTIVVENIDDVSKKSTTLKAEGVSQKCTELSYTITEKDAVVIAKNLLTALKKDSEIESIIKGVVTAADMGVDEREVYNEFVEEIEYALEEIDYYSDYDTDGYIQMSVYVDNEGEIIGRTLSFIDESSGDKEIVSINMLMPESGGKFGYEFSFEYGYESDYYSENGGVKLVGDGTRSGNTISGDFKVVCNDSDSDMKDQEVLKIKVTNFDTEELKNAHINGTFEITLEDTYDTDFEELSIIEDYSLIITSKMTDNSTDLKFEVALNNISFGAISLALKTSDGSLAKAPDSSNVVMMESYYDLMEWLEDVSLTQVVSNLKQVGIPQDWISMLEMASDAIESGDIYSLYGY